LFTNIFASLITGDSVKGCNIMTTDTDSSFGVAVGMTTERITAVEAGLSRAQMELEQAMKILHYMESGCSNDGLYPGQRPDVSLHVEPEEEEEVCDT
jgi:hypothetical protein